MDNKPGNKRKVQKMRVTPMSVSSQNSQRIEQAVERVDKQIKANSGDTPTIFDPQEDLNTKHRRAVDRFARKAEGVGRSIKRRIPRRGSNRGNKGRSGESGEKGSVFATMAIQVAICAGLALCAVALKYIDTPLAQTINGGIKSAMTMTVDFDESLGKLQFVQNVIPETVSVFWQSGEQAPETLQAPFAGKVVSKYSEELPGIEIYGTEMEVYAAEAGKVDSIEAGEDGGVTIIIKHTGGLYTVYSGLYGTDVKKNASVKKGQQIGFAAAKDGGYQMFFQVRDAEGTIDPLSIIAR